MGVYMSAASGDIFLSTPSARRATDMVAKAMASLPKFLSTPSARRATPSRPVHQGSGRGFLSTPSARRATRWLIGSTATPAYFYPRPPRGGRHAAFWQAYGIDLFLSTPSARRATTNSVYDRILLLYFYPRPPRGGRHVVLHGPLAKLAISIHALREEGDLQRVLHRRRYVTISIHALREEGDASANHFS